MSKIWERVAGITQGYTALPAGPGRSICTSAAQRSVPPLPTLFIWIGLTVDIEVTLLLGGRGLIAHFHLPTAATLRSPKNLFKILD